jgi:MFS family permease
MASKNPPAASTVDTKEISAAHDMEKDKNSELKHSIGKVQGNAAKDESVDTNFQAGVQKAEAITIVWSLRALIGAYVFIWFVYFAQGIVVGVSNALIPYVTSDFAAHSLIPTTSVLSQVIGGVSNLSIAKILDIFGRPHGFLLCVTIATIGLVMAAGCNGVEAYAGSQVFYTVGVNGLGYCLSVFIADTSSLRRRGLIQALLSSPYIITSWLAGPISTSFLNGSGWRWAFGMESILLPCVAFPLFGLFMYHYRKAKREGIVPARPTSGRTFWQSTVHYVRQFDLLGLLLLSVGFAFFLLPFNLYTMEAKGWGSAMIICFLVFGIFFIAAFVCWERFFAPISLTPWEILRDRTVLVITFTGRYKPISLYVAIPLIILGTGLLIHFREPTLYLGYIAMCNIFVNFGFGILMITVEIGILAAASTQQYFAITIAVLNLFTYIGNAVGFTISSAIWQRTFPEKLALHLPSEAQGNLATIFGSLEEQLAYEWDSPVRLAIQNAYGDTWRFLLITSVCLWALGLASTLAWKNMNVKGVKQNKGYVV